MVGKVSVLIPILARANFSPIKNPTFTGKSIDFLTDNLVSKHLYFYSFLPSNEIRKYDLLASTQHW